MERHLATILATDVVGYTGDIQIDGTIEGSVTGSLIIIGEQANVESLIVAELVRIFGTVNGRVQAKTA